MASELRLKRVVVDPRNHMLDPFVSIVAEDLLNGVPKIVVVLRCEKICLSGGLDSLKIKYSSFQGPTPSKIVRETIRGLLPHESEKGEAALGRLEVHEGVPPPYDNKKIKKFGISAALRVGNRHKKYCMLGTLCSELAGKRTTHHDAISELKKKRKERCSEMKKQLRKLRSKDDDKKVVVDTGMLTSQLMLFDLQSTPEAEESSHMRCG